MRRSPAEAGLEGDRAPGQRGIVGNQAINPGLQQRGGELWFVDGIDPDAQPESMGFADGRGVDLPVPDGDAGAECPDFLQPGGAQSLSESSSFFPPRFPGGPSAPRTWVGSRR